MRGKPNRHERRKALAIQRDNAIAERERKAIPHLWRIIGIGGHVAPRAAAKHTSKVAAEYRNIRAGS